ncbi:MAG: hypothetical protein JSS74_10930 [Actinobacteria bacterium]|nr:hypothetical protein [Actinomycetota bacterium]
MSIDTAPQTGWGLDYDAGMFLPLPSDEELRAEPAAAEAWTHAVLDHHAQSAELTPGDAQALRLTAAAMLTQVEPAVTRLHFAPAGLYSDVLISIVVADPASETAALLVSDVAAQGSSTAAEMVAVSTDDHGVGVLIRRTSAVPAAGEGDALLVAHWNLLLQGEHSFIAVDATGSTLDVFARLDQQLLPLVAGIRLPSREGATIARGDGGAP